MKTIYNLIIIFAGALILSSCNDFGDINENPNAPSEVPTSGMFTSVERDISSIVGNVFPTLYVQHLGEITYTEDSRYQTTQIDFNSWYYDALNNLATIKDLNTDEDTKDRVASSGSNVNQIAVANILEAYIMQMLVDRWGPVPYTEALEGREDLLPSYDNEQTIYSDIISKLNTAAENISEEQAGVQGDFIFNGDMSRWKAFANTLRMNMAIRMADVSDQAQSVFNDAVSDGLISTSVMYPYISDESNENPWFNRFRTREDYAISDVLVSYLNSTNDPRLQNYADPTQESVIAGDPEIVGQEYGLANPTAQPSVVSFPHSFYVRAQTRALPIITMAQVNFNMAEAAQRGWISDDPAMHYREGVKASWQQWGVYDSETGEDDLDTYLSQDGVEWGSDEWKKVLGQQKWVSLYIQGLEAWCEWRRLDYPQLEVAEQPLNPSKQIPLRVRYPSTEAELNSENYQQAVNEFLNGDNSDGARIWWDEN